MHGQQNIKKGKVLSFNANIFLNQEYTEFLFCILGYWRESCSLRWKSVAKFIVLKEIYSLIVIPNTTG